MNSIKQKTQVLVMNKYSAYMLMAFIFAAALFYVYFANVAVRTVTALETTREELQTLSIEVSEMESERLAIQNTVNTVMAKQLGFVEVNHPTFIMKSSKKTAFYFNTN